MGKRRASLTGSWSGAYRYPGTGDEETVFNAQIEEVGGAFIGQTQEPNHFAAGAGNVLTADIEGVRTGAAVTFTKFYHHGGIAHAVRYQGLADDALTRIEGAWTIRSTWSGSFFMLRDDCGVAETAEEDAHAAVVARI